MSRIEITPYDAFANDFIPDARIQANKTGKDATKQFNYIVSAQRVRGDHTDTFNGKKFNPNHRKKQRQELLSIQDVEEFTADYMGYCL